MAIMVTKIARAKAQADFLVRTLLGQRAVDRQKITDLEGQIKILQEKSENDDKTIDELLAKIKKLEVEIAAVVEKERIAVEKAEVLEKERDGLTQELDAAKKTIEKLEQELEELRKRIKDLEDKKPGFWNCFSLPPQV